MEMNAIVVTVSRLSGQHSCLIVIRDAMAITQSSVVVVGI